MNAPETPLPPYDAPPEPETQARNRLVISLLLVSAFVVILNETIMAVAIPRLMKDLDVTASAAQWLTTAFMLTMAVVIPVTGFLLQRLHTRPVFLLAMTLFSLGTLVSALAPGLGVLVVGRVIQASGTAIMMPLLMTTVMNLVPPESRGKTMGNISLVMSVAPAIGPALSGLVLSVLSWRWLFLLVLPIALGAMALGAAKLVNVNTPRYAPLDVLSVILSAFSFGGLVYGLSHMGKAGAEAGPVSGEVAAAVGAVTLVVFVWRQLALQKEERALLDLRVFRSSTFALAIGMMGVSTVAMFGTFILLPLYMQDVLGLDTLKTGLMLMPGALTMGLLARKVGSLNDKYGPTVLAVPGVMLTNAALWSLTLVGEHTWFGWVLAAHVVMSVGLALTFTPVFSASLGSLARELYSHGSAVIGTCQQVAGAAGTALFVAVMSHQAAGLLAAGASQVGATAGGIRTAFFWGAVIGMFAIPAAFFVKKPAAAGV